MTVPFVFSSALPSSLLTPSSQDEHFQIKLMEEVQYFLSLFAAEGEIMIFGIGVDFCSHSRMRRILENGHFMKRVFHEKEMEYAFSRPFPERYLASSFAAREAFKKASGVPFFKVIFRGIWVDRTDRGPFLRYDEKILPPVLAEEDLKIHLSISHEKDMALAMVVMEV